MQDWLNRELWHNTVGEWLIAAAWIVGILILRRVIYRLLSRVVKRTTPEDKSLPLTIFEMIEEPFVFGLIVFVIWQAISPLTLTQSAQRGLSFVYFVLMITAVTWLIVRIFDAVIQEYALPHVQQTENKLDDALLPILTRAGKIFIWTTAVIIALDNAGVDVIAILASLGVGGIALALAAQHSLENIIAGLAILADRHFGIGERIQLRGPGGGLIDGEVVDMGLRSVKVRTRYEGRVVSIPNAVVAGQDVVNVESEKGRQTFAVYKLSPKTSHQEIEEALTLLKAIAKNHENSKDLVITGLLQVTEISRDIMLLYWIKPEASNLKTRTAVNLEIIRQFEEAGIEFTDKSVYEYNKQVFL